MKKLTSDLHFRHRNICNYTNRNLFTTSEKHDAWVTSLWNSEVSEDDDVYHLGDFCFSAAYDVLAGIVRSLKGRKHFIIGNHDKEENFKRLRREGLIESYGHYKEIKIGDTKVCLSHYPMTVWNRQHYGSFMLHGHCHGSFQGQGKILDVGLDNVYNIYQDHRFLTEDQIVSLMEERELYVGDGHSNR